MKVRLSFLALMALLAACRPQASSNPTQGQVQTEIAAALGEATLTIPPPYFTFEEESYADRISHSNTALLNALDAFIAHKDLLIEQPELLDDAGWREELQIRLDALRTAGERVGEIGPAPKIFVNLHPMLAELEAAAHVVADDYEDYALNGDEAKGELTQANIDEVTLWLHNIAVSLREITFEAFGQ